MSKNKPSKYKVIFNGLELDLDIPGDTYISVDNLVEDLASQASLLAFYGELQVQAQHEKRILEDQLSLVISAARLDVRSQGSEKRLTKDFLDDTINLLPAIIEAKEKLRNCEYVVDRITAAYNAVKARGQSLNSTAQIYKAELNINDKLLEQKVLNIRRG